MYVMDVCSRKVVGVNDTAYPTDSVVFIFVVHLPGSTETFGGCSLRIVVPHDATSGMRHLTDLDRLGINHGNILPSINAHGNLLADFLRKRGCKFQASINLPEGYVVGDAFGRFSQPFEEVIFTVVAESLDSEGKCMTSKSEKTGTAPFSRH